MIKPSFELGESWEDCMELFKELSKVKEVHDSYWIVRDNVDEFQKNCHRWPLNTDVDKFMADVYFSMWFNNKIEEYCNKEVKSEDED